MADITIIDNEYVTLKYLEDKRTIYHVVHQPISGPPLREMLSTGLDALKKYGVTKWIGDDRKNGPMTDEDRIWADANISNRVVESGWKYWALVIPEQIVAAGLMAPIIQANYEKGMRMMVFINPEEAFAWLEQFDDQPGRAIDPVMVGRLRHTRKLNDGREFRIIKVFYEAEPLSAALSAAGFTAAVQTTGNYFWYTNAYKRIVESPRG